MKLGYFALLFVAMALIVSCVAPPPPAAPPPPPAAPPPPPAPAPTPTPTPAPVTESPCALTVERVGQDVQVAGEITFVDDLGPEGMHADLEAEGCRIGIWVDRQRWNFWSAEEQAAWKLGARVTVEGHLVSFEDQLIVELSSPPRLQEEIEVPIKPTYEKGHIIEGFPHVDFNYYNDEKGYPSWAAGVCYMGSIASIISHQNKEFSPELVTGVLAIAFGGPMYEQGEQGGFWPHDTMYPAVELDHLLHTAMLLGCDAALLDVSTKEEALTILKCAVSNDIPVVIGQDWNYCLDEYAEQSPMFEEYKGIGVRNWGTHKIVVTGYDKDEGLYYIHDFTDIMPYGLRYLTEDKFLLSWEKGREVEHSPSPLGAYPKEPYTLLVFVPSRDEIDLKNVYYASLKDAHRMVTSPSGHYGLTWSQLLDELFADIERMSWEEIDEVIVKKFSEWPPDFRFGAGYLREAGIFWGGEPKIKLDQAAELYDDSYELIDTYIKREIGKESKESLITLFEELISKKQKISEILDQAIKVIEADHPDLKYQQWNSLEAMGVLRELAYLNGEVVKAKALE